MDFCEGLQFSLESNFFETKVAVQGCREIFLVGEEDFLYGAPKAPLKISKHWLDWNDNSRHLEFDNDGHCAWI